VQELKKGCCGDPFSFYCANGTGLFNKGILRATAEYWFYKEI
jgi:hypothetical protein